MNQRPSAIRYTYSAEEVSKAQGYFRLLVLHAKYSLYPNEKVHGFLQRFKFDKTLAPKLNERQQASFDLLYGGKQAVPGCEPLLYVIYHFFHQFYCRTPNDSRFLVYRGTTFRASDWLSSDELFEVEMSAQEDSPPFRLQYLKLQIKSGGEWTLGITRTESVGCGSFVQAEGDSKSYGAIHAQTSGFHLNNIMFEQYGLWNLQLEYTRREKIK